MRVASVTLLSNGDMSGDLTSSPQQLNQAMGYGIQATYTTSGSLGGTFKLQGSLTYQAQPFGTPAVGTWVDITGSSLTIAAAGGWIWDASFPNYPWVRLVYTHTGGDSGILNVVAFERAF